jgi:hypothetical protein
MPNILRLRHLTMFHPYLDQSLHEQQTADKDELVFASIIQVPLQL